MRRIALVIGVVLLVIWIVAIVILPAIDLPKTILRGNAAPLAPVAMIAIITFVALCAFEILGEAAMFFRDVMLASHTTVLLC